MESVASTISVKSFDENGILHVKIIDGAHIDLDAITADYVLCKEITRGKKVAALLDARAFFTITAEARSFAQENISNQLRLATAVLADTVAVKILAYGYIKINKPACPMKIFHDMGSALEWLGSFVSPGVNEVATKHV